jgi:GNAT superfamily N-acetyltransferase
MPVMRRSPGTVLRKWLRDSLRWLLALLPRSTRFALFRRLVVCDPRPDAAFELKIADTQDELEACFRILHDAYVAAGFMKADPSGLRVTPYHALPTTTTLCAKFEGRVVGTITIIREGVFGFPMQAIFDLAPVRACRGRIAEISALAVDPAFRKTGGQVLFPLMKFMYEYCREYFDTRHIVIAVNPNKSELYESLLFFQRLQAHAVKNYDFANGAPAVGASLDLQLAPERFRAAYHGRAERQDLHHYFVHHRLPNIRWPQRRFFTTNDPVLTPALMDHFFNRRTQVFASLDDRRRLLLRSIYGDPAYAGVLPAPSALAAVQVALRQQRRFSICCPAEMRVQSYGTCLVVPMNVIEVSQGGFQAECALPLPEGTRGQVVVELGERDTARIEATAVRRHVAAHAVYYGFRVHASDTTWQHGVSALAAGLTHSDLAPRPDPTARAEHKVEVGLSSP